ncbi:MULTISPECIES: hypothetical protein [unclassified Beijerinckia]|uniref:hypothetical protein n=1 Tax=unclassified Beijerinckia TaxID=2638183 RepID=UPI00089D5BD5|nr:MULTISPECIES: hypothetical protein [unclassified Beijerinckia]MDH7794092.1 hypothetical protein [Beijerinckia sp. GAS462]SEB53141.1 hypothetical protein SAMN05443249_0358 [Beijerinckia sp. 28-YEA-48]
MTSTIDRPARDTAASLIRRFRDGEISNDQFENQWPKGSTDPALSALKDMIWQFYDARYEHTLTWRHTLKPDGHEAFTRFACFADSDLPYEWPPRDFKAATGLGGFIITVGLLAALIGWANFGWMAAIPVVVLLFWLDWRIHARHDQAQKAFEAAGDVTAWPFNRADDYEAARRTAPSDSRKP